MYKEIVTHIFSYTIFINRNTFNKTFIFIYTTISIFKISINKFFKFFIYSLTLFISFKLNISYNSIFISNYSNTIFSTPVKEVYTTITFIFKT